MDRCLISVIIPVYNVSNYLAQCLESVLGQTYTNLQIICVDDGSTDGSGEICDFYAKKDSRLHVIHQKNAGAGAARNIGLSFAEGDFIGFVDSDDYIAPEMYRSLLNALTQTESDIAASNTVEVFQNRIVKCDSNGDIHCFSGMELLKRTSEHWKYYIMVNKLFRRELVQGIKFPEGNIIDDGFYTYQIIAKARKVAWIERDLYYYRQRSSSVMNLAIYAGRRYLDTISLVKQKLEYVKCNYPEAVPAFERKMLDTFVTVISSGTLSTQQRKACVKYMRKNCRHTLFKQYNFQESIWFVLFMIATTSMSDSYAKRSLSLGEDNRFEFFD